MSHLVEESMEKRGVLLMDTYSYTMLLLYIIHYMLSAINLFPLPAFDSARVFSTIH